MIVKMNKAMEKRFAAMPIRFFEDGYTYFCDRFVCYRYIGLVENIPLDPDTKQKMAWIFDAVKYDYTLAENQPSPEALKGKNRVLFGMEKQLVNATYIREVFSFLGKKACFYPSTINRFNPVYATVWPWENKWEAVIMPVRYGSETEIDMEKCLDLSNFVEWKAI